MRGEVLKYDDTTGQGLISGDDGNRYRFSRSDLQQLKPVRRGIRVDFDAYEGTASDIFIVDGRAVSSSSQDSGASEYLTAAPTENRSTPIDESMGPGLWGYFIKCMKMYTNGYGRAQRVEYWSFVLFYSIFLIAAVMVDVLLAASEFYYEVFDGDFVPIFTVLYLLGTALPAICLSIRRLHDVGLSGWLYLVSLVPYVGGIFMLVISLIPSQRHSNVHGPHPKMIHVENTFD